MKHPHTERGRGALAGGAIFAAGFLTGGCAVVIGFALAVLA
ncbi:hypothetical protein [Parvibaculum sp.]|nr:hypothetical protein [Parvibaculum sp.]